MIRKSSFSVYFWTLIALSIGLVWLALLFSRTSVQIWLEAVWQTCQNGWHYLVNNPPLTWQMIIPLILVVILGRASWSLTRQFRATQRMIHLFRPLQADLPERLKTKLSAHQLTVEDIVFLKVDSVHAFCLGFRRPRIWLTAGLVNLLTDDELAAVLAHEVRHFRQRDPLRLLVSRALKSAFFFLPLIKSLADAAELQQETEADRHAIAHLGDDLPLLCALQKILKYNQPLFISETATYTAFNLSEARLKKLIYPATPRNWSKIFWAGVINLVILLALSSTIYLTCMQPAAPSLEVGACIADSLQSTSTQLPVLNYNW